MKDAGLAELKAAPALRGSLKVDVVSVGGGYTGMWTAVELCNHLDPARIAIVESEICGTGPSGRNGGFCHGLADEVVQLEARFGADAARRLILRSIAEASAIGQWAGQNGIEIDFRTGGELIVSRDPAHDSACDSMIAAAERIGLTDEFGRVAHNMLHARCSIAGARSAVFGRNVSTLHPGKLALGLREFLIEKGVQVFEGSAVTEFGAASGGVVVHTKEGQIRAGSGVLSAGVASASWKGLKRETTLTSSHMVITEPVPDVIAELGWTGGEAVIDSRTLVHYMRATADNRIAFGWGGGAIGFGARPRPRDSFSPNLAAKVARDLVDFFPSLVGRRVEHAWGGPIDASPCHLPAVRPLAGGVWHACFRFTGNGVGPSRLCSQLLAQLAIDPRADVGELGSLVVSDAQRVPPEPFRKIGGSAIMRAIDAVEKAGEAGRRAPALARALSRVPDVLGYRIGR